MRILLGIFGVIVVIIAAVLLLTNRGPSTTSQVGERRVEITDYIDEPSTVTYTMEGELNAEEDRRSIRISINRNMRKIEVISGYNNTVIKSQDFSNTQAAYDEFINGLKNAGFNREKEAEFESEKGVCPLGNRYIYELEDDGENVFRLWSTSCGRKDGSMGGNASLVKQLFQKQIPEYPAFVKGVRL